MTTEARNVLGTALVPCSYDPLTGFLRDGCCSTGPEDLGSHTICAVVTAEFLAHQRSIGNDLSTPMPQYRFPGLTPGDRWCVTALNWLRAHTVNRGLRAHGFGQTLLLPWPQRALAISTTSCSGRSPWGGRRGCRTRSGAWTGARRARSSRS